MKQKSVISVIVMIMLFLITKYNVEALQWFFLHFKQLCGLAFDLLHVSHMTIQERFTSSFKKSMFKLVFSKGTCTLYVIHILTKTDFSDNNVAEIIFSYVFTREY